MDSFHSQAREVAETILAMPKGTSWTVSCDTDADGISSAALMLRALSRAGHRAKIVFSRDKTRQAFVDLHALEGPLMILDKGTSKMDILSRPRDAPIVLVDHHLGHRIEAEHLHVLNPRFHGLDGGRDACSSTSSFLLATKMDEEAWKQAGWGIIGAIGDWQHRGGWRGWNRELLDEAQHRGILQIRDLPALVGLDLAEAMSRHDAHIPWIWRGDREEVLAILDAVDIRNVTDVELLTSTQQSLLLDVWLQAWLYKPDGLEQALPHMIEEAHWDPVRSRTLRFLYRRVDALARSGRPDLALSYLLGDHSLDEEAEATFRSWSQHIRQELLRVRDALGTADQEGALHVRVDHPGRTGMVAGLAMTHLVTDPQRILVTTAELPDGWLQVSTRGTHEQVRRGLDLHEAVHDAAIMAGGEGGGHAQAAGARIPGLGLTAFLTSLQEALIPMLGLE